MNKIDYINHTQKRNRILKYLFLVSGALLFFSLLTSFFNREKEVDDDAFASEASNSLKGFDLSLGNPILEGLSKDNLPYKIIASIVTRNDSSRYDMNLINAEHKLTDGILSIKAEKGKFDEGIRLFTLLQEVVINFDNLTLTGEKIDLNLYSNLISSTSPVEVTFKGSKIKAKSFNADSSNKIISFQGNVVAILSPEDF